MQRAEVVKQLESVKADIQRKIDNVANQPWKESEKAMTSATYHQQAAAIDVAIRSLSPEERRPMSEFFEERENKGHEG